MVWICGSHGALGTEVSRALNAAKISSVCTGRELDITNFDAIEVFVKSTESASYLSAHQMSAHVNRKITWIVNCAAYTNVDAAEDDAETAKAVNTDGPANLALVARNHSARLIHISTDYVFDGKKSTPYSEDDAIAPLSVYGRTKAAGDDAIARTMTQYYIVRTAWLYSFTGKNFVYTMTQALNKGGEVKVASDRYGCPTFAGDVAVVIVRLIEKAEKAAELFGKNSPAPYGIYNFACAGEASRYEFAKAICEFGKKYGRIQGDGFVTPCMSGELPSLEKARRPGRAVLATAKIARELTIKIPEWRRSLERFIKSARFDAR